MTITLDFGDTMDLTPGMKLRLRLPPLTDEQLFDIYCRNELWRFEREPNGELTVGTLKDFADALRIGELTFQLGTWNRVGEGRKGLVSNGGAGFILPNRAIRTPIASWLSIDHWQGLKPEDRAGFARTCPHFVAEMRTENVPLNELDLKMREYRKCGAKLGLLFDPRERTVYVYRPDAEAEILTSPTQVSCEPEMPGLIINTKEIFRSSCELLDRPERTHA